VPTLPLFESPVAAPGASHHVKAPGGYEIWRFIAHDSSSQTSIEISFVYGFSCSRYFRRYMRYRAHPTRVSPPLPQDYPTVTVSILSANRFVASTTRLEPVPAATAADLKTDFSRYGFTQECDRSIHLRRPGVDLTFRPMFSREPIEVFLAPEHRWVLAHGLCEVCGWVEASGTKMAIAGEGFHDQFYGTKPMLGSSFRGHLFLKDRLIAFNRTDLMYTAAFGNDSVPLAANPLGAARLARTRWGLSYPSQITLEDGMLLAHARVITSRPTAARVFYEVTWDGKKGSAICEIHAPRRLGVLI
jgi:hypothetical protein